MNQIPLQEDGTLTDLETRILMPLPPPLPSRNKVPEITRDINDKNGQVKHSVSAQTNDPFTAGFGH